MDIDPNITAITENAWWSLGSAGLALYFYKRRSQFAEFLILKQTEGRVRWSVQLDREEVATFSTLEEAVAATDYEVGRMGKVARETARETAEWRFEPITDGLKRQLANLRPPRRASSVAEAMRYLVYSRWSKKRKWGQ